METSPPDEEDGIRRRFSAEGDRHGIDIAFAPDFWDEVSGLDVEARIDCLVDRIRAACYILAGIDSTRH